MMPHDPDHRRQAGSVADEQLTEACDHATSLPDSPTPDDGPRIEPWLADWQRYQVLEPLGAGGMGKVYKAWDPRLKRHVAIKLLSSDDPDRVQRFLREAQTQARVEHDHVCRVHEVGVVAGTPFIAMQLIEGQSLAALAERSSDHPPLTDPPAPPHPPPTPPGGLTTEQKVMIIARVAEAVHAAHRQGLIHRDLKPANIMVEATEDGELRPWVVDFGLARELSDANLTMTGEVLGTPAYMAPEQAVGDTAQIDRRSDVYSLGATLYWLLAGTTPYQATSAAGMLLQVINADVRPLRAVVRQVPLDLESIVMQCLEEEPRRRYQSARALAEDLQAYLGGEPVSAHPPSLGYRLVKKARKHRWAVAASLLALLLLLSFALLTWYSRHRTAQRVAIAQDFGRRVERIEAVLRRTHTLPLHDIRPELSEVTSMVVRIEADMLRLGKVAEGPGYYALGRAALIDGDAEKARDLLEKAVNAGYRSGEVSAALGEALGELYRQAVTDVRRIYDPELRQRRRNEIQQQLREPALQYLEEALQAGIEEASSVEVLIAFYESRFTDVIPMARAVYSRQPWLYKVRAMEGRALVELGIRQTYSGEYEQAAEQFHQAEQVLSEGIDIARSDPGLRTNVCKLATKQLMLVGMSGDSGPGLYDIGRQRCQQGLQVNPDNADLLAQICTLHCRWAQRLIDDGDPRVLQTVELAVEAGERAVQLQPESFHALHQLAVAYELRCEIESQTGVDASRSLTRVIALNRAALKIRPDSDWPHASLGGVYTSQGLSIAAQGGDPRVEYNRAIAALGEAHRLNPLYAWPGNQGHISNLIGSHELDIGLDPLPTVEKTLAYAEAALAMNPKFGFAFEVLTRAHLTTARYAIDQGENPDAAVHLAARAIQQALTIHDDRVVTLTLAARVELLSSHLRDSTATMVEAHLRQAELYLQRARVLAPNLATVELNAAGLNLRRAQLGTPGSTTYKKVLTTGLAAVDQALLKDPELNEAVALRGTLLLLQARSQVAGTVRNRLTRQAANDLQSAIDADHRLERRFRPYLDEALAFLAPT